MSMRFGEETFTHGSHPGHRFRPIDHLPRMMQCSICSALESQGAWYECCEEQCHYILCPKCFEVDEKLFDTPQIVIRKTEIPFDDATICVHTRPRPSSYKLSPINPCKLMEVVSRAVCREDESLTYLRLYKGGWVNSRHVAAISPSNRSIYNLAMIHINQVHAMRMYDVAVNARITNTNSHMHKLLFPSSSSSSSSSSPLLSPCHEDMIEHLSANSLMRYMEECMKTIDINIWNGFVMSVFTIYPLILAIDMHKDDNASANNYINNNSSIDSKNSKGSCSESRTKCHNADMSVAEEDVISGCSSYNMNSANNNISRREQLLRHKGYCHNGNVDNNKNNRENTFAFDEDCADEEQMEVCNSSKSQSYSRNQVQCVDNTIATIQSSVQRQTSSPQTEEEPQLLIYSPYQRSVKDVIVKFVYFITEAVLFDMNEALNENNNNNNNNNSSIMNGVRLSLYTDVLSGVLLVAQDLTHKWQVQLPAAFVQMYTCVLTLCAQMHVLMQHINITTDVPRLREPAVVTRHIDIPTERIRIRQLFRCLTEWSHSQLLTLTQHYNSPLRTLQPLREQLIVMPHSEVFERIFCELLLQIMEYDSMHESSIFWSVDPIEIIVRLIRGATSWESQLVACKLIRRTASCGASEFRHLSIVALLPLMHMTKSITNVHAILAALQCIETFTQKPQKAVQPQQCLRKHWRGWSKHVLRNAQSANGFNDSEFNKDEDGYNDNDNDNGGGGGERKCRDARTPEILGDIRVGTSPEVSPVRVRCNQCTSHTVQQQQIHFFTLASGLTVGLCEYCAQMHPPSEANVTSLDEIYYNSCIDNYNSTNHENANTNDMSGNEGKDYAHQKLLDNNYLEFLKKLQHHNINNNNNYLIGARSHSPVYFVCQCTICVKANNSDCYAAVANGMYTQEEARSRSPYMHSNNNNNNDDNGSGNNVNCVNGNTDNSEEMKFVNDAVCTIFDGDRLSQFLRRILQDHYTQPHIVNAVGRLLLHIPMMQTEVWKMLFEVLASVQRLDCYHVALLAIASRRYLPVVDELCKQLNQSSTLAHYLHEPYILLTPTKRLCTEEMVCGGSSSNQLSSVGLSPSPLTTSTYRSSVVSEVQFSGIGYSHNHPVVNLFASSDGMLMRESEERELFGRYEEQCQEQKQKSEE